MLQVILIQLLYQIIKHLFNTPLIIITKRDALWTSFINCFTSILSGFVVFSTLGHMAHVQGKTIEEVTEPGPGLIFITYPQAISLMPWAPLWAVIFFFMLFTLGIDSTVTDLNFSSFQTQWKK